MAPEMHADPRLDYPILHHLRQNRLSPHRQSHRLVLILLQVIQSHSVSTDQLFEEYARTKESVFVLSSGLGKVPIPEILGDRCGAVEE